MIKIEQYNTFKYSFFISRRNDDDRDEAIKSEVANLATWCNENVKSQWVITRVNNKYSLYDIVSTFCAPVTHTPPIEGYYYKPSTVEICCEYIFSFENEEDAVAFKMRWDK